MAATGIEPTTTEFIKEHSDIERNWSNDWTVLWVLIWTVHLTLFSYHVIYAFQSESTLYTCLNVKELLARRRGKIWSLSDSNWTRTLNHFVKLGTYLYCALDCMLLKCHMRISEDIHTLYLRENKKTPC